jgi:hypothetical protein
MSGSNFFISQIDPNKPDEIIAFTGDVRGNFGHAKREIEELYRAWENGEFSVGPGGIGEAPATGRLYSRNGFAEAWEELTVIDGGYW